MTAYPNQAIVLQVPYEMLLQYMEHYDQLYFVVDERPASEAEKQKLAEFKAVLREMDEVYGAQKEGYQLKFDSLLLEALYRLLVDYAVRIGKEHIPQNQKAVQQIREVMRYIEEHYAKKLTVAQVAEHFGYTPNYLSKLLKRYLGLTVYQYLYEIRLDRICRDLQHPEARIMELLPKHGCENFNRQQAFEQAQKERLQKDIARLRKAARQTSVWSDRIEEKKYGAGPVDRGYIGHKAQKMMKRAKTIEARQSFRMMQAESAFSEVSSYIWRRKIIRLRKSSLRFTRQPLRQWQERM